MAATSESPHLPPLRPDARRAVGQDLEATLLELIDLSLFGKQLQLSVTGEGHLGGVEFLTPEERPLPSVLAAAER
jgi:hypothetical protein